MSHSPREIRTGPTAGTAAATEKGDGLARRVLGRYLLRHRLAEGGMASVYLAQNRSVEGFRKWLAHGENAVGYPCLWVERTIDSTMRSGER